jgi:nucleolar GTP-binding protein
MLVHKLGKVEDYKTYMDTAMKRGNKAAEETRDTVRGRDRIVKSKNIELARVRGVKQSLSRAFVRIFERFPKFDELHPFYYELIELYHDVGKIRKALAAIQWVVRKIDDLERDYVNKIKHAEKVNDVNPLRKQFFARTDSVVKRLKNELPVLDEFRRFCKWLPPVRTSMFTVCISGFPNVGKSTLLSKVTDAKPEISYYPFTTRRINLGYIMKDGNRSVQLIDTPGTLNRFNKMNEIEKLAYLAMKHVSDSIVYIYDYTKQYPWEDQKSLHKNLEEFGVKIIPFLSKIDLLSEEEIKEVKKDIKGIITDREELVKELAKLEEDFEGKNE